MTTQPSHSSEDRRFAWSETPLRWKIGTVTTQVGHDLSNQPVMRQQIVARGPQPEQDIEVMPVAEHEAKMETARNLRIADERAAQRLSDRIEGLRQAALVALQALERGSHPRDDARVEKALKDALAEHAGLDLR